MIGSIEGAYRWDWAAGEASLNRALALEPGNVLAIRNAAGLASVLGRQDESLRLIRRATELDPLSSAAWQNLGLYAYRAGRYGEAVAAFQKGLELNPERQDSYAFLGVITLLQGKPQEALVDSQKEPAEYRRHWGLAIAHHALKDNKKADEALADLIGKYQGMAAYQIAEVYAFRGESDNAFEWLERAYVQRDGGLNGLKVSPLLTSLRGDPRYVALLKKMRLPE